jgi:HTH-type transcriptional regulator, glycine betaine synthesis regulator
MDEAPDSPLMAVADAIGALMEFWGFKRAMGRIWAILYLSPQPLTAQELQERLTMSAGAVSMTVADLLKWGVVLKTWKPGDRRDYFQAETSIWKMVTRVFRQRELLQVRAAIETFESTIKALAGAMKTAKPDDKKRLKFASERLELLLGLARMGETLISAIIEGERIDPAPIRKFFSKEE